MEPMERLQVQLQKLNVTAEKILEKLTDIEHGFSENHDSMIGQNGDIKAKLDDVSAKLTDVRVAIEDGG